MNITNMGTARAEQQYLEILPDLPIMDGLEKVPDSTIVFDKPDGRIAETVYFSETITAENIEAFYNEVLPQLGWTSEQPLRFSREQDQLIFKASQHKDEAIIVFSLSPIQSGIRK